MKGFACSVPLSVSGEGQLRGVCWRARDLSEIVHRTEIRTKWKQSQRGRVHADAPERIHLFHGVA